MKKLILRILYSLVPLWIVFGWTSIYNNEDWVLQLMVHLSFLLVILGLAVLYYKESEFENTKSLKELEFEQKKEWAKLTYEQDKADRDNRYYHERVMQFIKEIKTENKSVEPEGESACEKKMAEINKYVECYAKCLEEVKKIIEK